MGIVNVTPNSFSDGGDWFQHEAAIARGLELTQQGAHMIDVGGESTRPGLPRTEPEEELRRVLPVVEALAGAGAVVSVDTMRAVVAEESIKRGAAIINDVSGGLADPDMLRVVAEAEVPYIVMHWRAHSTEMQNLAHYDDVVADVSTELSARVDAALAAGVRAENIILDPGIGFAKTTEHNWQLLRNLDQLDQLGFPLLIGVSRKRFLGELLDGRPPKERDAATTTITALLAQERVWAVRTHVVRENLDAIAVVEEFRRSARPEA